MGGEGSMSHMIISMRINRALRRSKRRKFRNQKISQVSTILRKWKKIEISEEELQQIKKEIKAKIQKDKRLYNLVAIALTLLFILLVYHFRAYF
ncbi:MAG TPA: hypothetical protein EYG92_12305 [Lutibacter sp.]|nr:hypothetical protein [Lutibacter sp.]